MGEATADSADGPVFTPALLLSIIAVVRFAVVRLYGSSALGDRSYLYNNTGKSITLVNTDQKEGVGGGQFAPGKHRGIEVRVGHTPDICLIIQYTDGSGEIVRLWDQDWHMHLAVSSFGMCSEGTQGLT